MSLLIPVLEIKEGQEEEKVQSKLAMKRKRQKKEKKLEQTAKLEVK